MSAFTRAEQVFPIYKVEHDCLVSVQGDITIAYQVFLPEIFTLSDEDYETYHQSWIRAVKVLPKHSIVHKQDIFIRNAYAGPQGIPANFLTTAADRHFKGRPFLDHTCYLMLTKKAVDRKQANSGFSGIMRKSITPKQTTDERALPDFLEKAGQFERIFCSITASSLMICLLMPFGRIAMSHSGNNYQPAHIGLPSVSALEPRNSTNSTDSLTKPKR